MTSAVGTSSNNVSLALIRAKLTPSANSCGTPSSTSAVYAYSGEAKLYTASTGDQKQHGQHSQSIQDIHLMDGIVQQVEEVKY